MGVLKCLVAAAVLSSIASLACGEANASVGGRCGGCWVNGRCLEVGVRLQGHYCWVDGGLQPQRRLGSGCENGFECVNNRCTGGFCGNQEPKSLFDELKDWIFHIFRIVVIKRI
jgi:hypothetical protein